VLETEGYGLRNILDSDHIYKPLSNKLLNQCSGLPNEIKKPVMRYERYLYGFSSVILFDELRVASLGRSLPNTIEAKLTRYSDLEKEVLGTLEERVTREINKFMGD
jgi:hypothetical protein